MASRKIVVCKKFGRVVGHITLADVRANMETAKEIAEDTEDAEEKVRYEKIANNKEEALADLLARHEGWEMHTHEKA
jgi:hypothetical protein